jgi:hypothetical protein
MLLHTHCWGTYIHESLMHIYILFYDDISPLAGLQRKKEIV